MKATCLSVIALVVAFPVLADTGEEIALVRKVFQRLQPVSVAENVEYCGYIGFDRSGRLVASEAVAGGADWCEAPWPEDLDVVASYHTHAGFDPDAWSEIPSGTEMETDEDQGIDGYVATPGGRLWYIDTEDMTAIQLCGIGCLPQDPRFVPIPEDAIRAEYSYDDPVEKLDQ